MNVDDMTDEEFIDYCRNGGELSGLITERHPKCDWCGGMCRVGRDGMCRNCRIRERRRTDPEYERIDNIENVQVGDIACTTEGNHFRVIDLKPDSLGDMLLRIRISEIGGEYYIDSDDFAYALRRKPKLPDHDGLWWDKDNALWSVAISGLDNSKLVALLIGDPESPVTGSVWSGLNSKHVTSQAPFRPAKAVEA